ncbi:MAG: hypothetical protein ACI977_000674 [Candidatus Nanohaloarchaea archaeon]|jgi:hypothetical protein
MLEDEKINSDWESDFPVEPKYMLVGAAALLAVTLFALPFVMDAYLLEKKQASFNTSAEVIPNGSPGVNTENNSLDFGRMIEDKMNFTRSIPVETGRDTLVLLDISGNITDHLDYQRIHRFNNSKSIDIRMIANESGNYTGTINVNIQAANRTGGSAWLDIKQEFY